MSNTLLGQTHTKKEFPPSVVSVNTIEFHQKESVWLTTLPRPIAFSESRPAVREAAEIHSGAFGILVAKFDVHF